MYISLKKLMFVKEQTLRMTDPIRRMNHVLRSDIASLLFRVGRTLLRSLGRLSNPCPIIYSNIMITVSLIYLRDH